MRRLLKQCSGKFCFILVTMVLAVSSYLLGAKGVLANPRQQCVDCTCKMVYAWTIPDNKASGMKTQENPPRPLLYGRAIQAVNCPDPPKPCANSTLVDRYEYIEFRLTCDDNPNSRSPQEAEVIGLGTRVAIGVHHSTCIPEEQMCPPIADMR